MPEQSNRPLVETIECGDMVTILTPQHQTRKGRAIMHSSHDGWLLNCGGGKRGNPIYANDSNVIDVQKARRRKKPKREGDV